MTDYQADRLKVGPVQLVNPIMTAAASQLWFELKLEGRAESLEKVAAVK